MNQPVIPSPVTPTITVGNLKVPSPPSVAQPAIREAVRQYSDWIQWADSLSRYDAPDQGTYRSMYTQSSVMQQALSSAESGAGIWEKKVLFAAAMTAANVHADQISELSKTLLEHARVMSNVGACWSPVDQKWQMVRSVYCYDLLRFQRAHAEIEDYNADQLMHILQSSNTADDRKFGVEVPRSMYGLYGKIDPNRWKDFSVLSYVSSVLCPVVLTLKSTKTEVLTALTFQDVQTLLSSRCSAEMRAYQWSNRPQLPGLKLIQVRTSCESGVKKSQDAVFSYLSSVQSKRSDKPQVLKWLDESTQSWAKDLSQAGPCLIKTGRGGHLHVLPVAVLAMSTDPSSVVSKWVAM